MKNAGIEIILAEKGLIGPADIDQAALLSKETGVDFGQALLRIGAVSEEALLGALAEQTGVAVLDGRDLPADGDALTKAADLLKLPPRWIAGQDAAFWFDSTENGSGAVHVSLVAQNPLKLELREALDSALSDFAAAHELDPAAITLTPYLASRSILDQLKAQLLADAREISGDQDDLDAQRLREMAEEAPIIDYVNRLFADSLRDNASDIHIEPFEHHFDVRFRVDGILHRRDTQPRAKFPAVASRIKLLSGMDISEQRLPQDGRQSVRFAGEALDLRVSSLPGTWGESLVLRLLRKEQSLPDLDGLGLGGRAREAFDQLIKLQNGIILVTGPTGSGKSTTLYRGLEEVNDGIRKIITIEDPVEYNMAGVTQIQVKSDIGYTFARGLRAILRQDPDVIMVGEIRDGETAGIAAQAALTGHLVFSTLHTNSALAAIERLLDLGLEPFLIASAVRGLAAQRLVRRLCPACSTPAPPGVGERLMADAEAHGADFSAIRARGLDWREPQGCPECGHTGYKGRLALYEVARVDDAMHAAIVSKTGLTDLLAIARSQGFLTLFEDGLTKAARGLTSVDEVVRVVGDAVEASAA
ncbi:MAG: ATPase, T2SS/T4P/T4SS family [Pseudomonadota bacterium]